jgi:restriction system protein
MSDAATEILDTQVPIWPALIVPVLEALSTVGTVHRKTLFDLAADRAGLSDAARSERLATGGLRYEQRMGWVLSHSVKAGWVSRPLRANYAITDAGREWLAQNQQGLNYSEARALFRPFWPNRDIAPGEKAVALEEATILDSIEPVEQIENAIQRIQEDVGEQLLERLRNSHPSFFERAVVKLLLAMGYGGADQRGRAIGGTGDGGVDGVIDQDALGLDRIYVQAKRYQAGSNIGRDTIQAFVGALAGVNASKGVFITTSAFTADAKNYVQTIQSRIILIDSAKLVSLMIEYGVGIQTRQRYSVVEVDEDFFE